MSQTKEILEAKIDGCIKEINQLKLDNLSNKYGLKTTYDDNVVMVVKKGVTLFMEGYYNPQEYHLNISKAVDWILDNHKLIEDLETKLK